MFYNINCYIYMCEYIDNSIAYHISHIHILMYICMCEMVQYKAVCITSHPSLVCRSWRDHQLRVDAHDDLPGSGRVPYQPKHLSIRRWARAWARALYCSINLLTGCLHLLPIFSCIMMVLTVADHCSVHYNYSCRAFWCTRYEDINFNMAATRLMICSDCPVSAPPSHDLITVTTELSHHQSLLYTHNNSACLLCRVYASRYAVEETRLVANRPGVWLLQAPCAPIRPRVAGTISQRQQTWDHSRLWQWSCWPHLQVEGDAMSVHMWRRVLQQLITSA